MRAASRGARVPALGPWMAAVVFATTACAAAPGDDPLAWLQRVADSARNTSYAGTFVHTNGDKTSTVRVTHRIIDGEEHERIEPLDGPPIEIVRRNEEMFCYLPDAKTVRLDRRVTARFFPTIFRAAPEAIARNYDVKLDKVERLIGLDCQWIHLDPKDAFRFAQRLCADVATGLLLRARTLDEKLQVVEQFTFTDLKIGSAALRNDVRSIFKARTKQWQTDTKPLDEAKGAETGWTIPSLPAGYAQVSEMRRTFPGRAQPVSQIVLSDGVANMSVFVESSNSSGSETARVEGATSFYSRPTGEYVITVLGEVPMTAARLVGRGIARRP